MNNKSWLFFALMAVGFCGIWGALIEIPEKAGFPATMGYVVWALSMIIPATIALASVRWKLEFNKKAVMQGLLIGLSGAAGQLILFQALKLGPAYLVFPIVSLSPVITILISMIVLKETASRRSWLGIISALIAIPLLSYQPPVAGKEYNFLWLILALVVFIFWGIQAFLMKIANNHMRAESIFFYMMVSALLFIPAAIFSTDFSKPINWGYRGAIAATGIQLLNAIGALFIVYAFRYGKAIIVSPLTNAGAPVLTIIVSLFIYGVFPGPIIWVGLILGVLAILLMAD